MYLTVKEELLKNTNDEIIAQLRTLNRTANDIKVILSNIGGLLAEQQILSNNMICSRLDESCLNAYAKEEKGEPTNG